MMKVVILAALCFSCLAQYDKIRANFDKLQAQKHHVEVKTYQYAAECGQKAHFRIKSGAASLLQHLNPGAGIEKFKPFEKVLKDGFQEVRCVKDDMYYSGDKFGDNKFSYKLGAISNVSIVHYDEVVAKEDQVAMTQKICFQFCRTVPHMDFFGMVNGRGCYCTPYFTPTASDSSDCDSVCEGDNTLMCGGKSKSSIFSMHWCASTEQDLGDSIALANVAESIVDDELKKAERFADDLQALGETLQASFGAVGDSGASRLGSEAKAFGGKLLLKAEKAEKIHSELKELDDAASKLSDFTKSDTITEAERIMEGVEASAKEIKTALQELAEMEAHAMGMHHPHTYKLEVAEVPKGNSKAAGGSGVELVAEEHYCGGAYTDPVIHESVEACANSCVENPAAASLYFDYSLDGACFCQEAGDCDEKVANAWHHVYKIVTGAKKVEAKPSPLEQYYPTMYFVDKEYEDMPMTCTGDLAGEPVISKSAEECAAACDVNIHSCAGFQYFERNGKSVCFLFKNFKTGFYYTGCKGSFLQTRGSPFAAKCYAKLAKFVGTTLKPNPSGKCKQCFRDLTKADRCYYK